MEQVRQDKVREVLAGHDGTWVPHPALVSVARSAFDENMQGPNQIARPLSPAKIVQHDLLIIPDGVVTKRGLRSM